MLVMMRRIRALSTANWDEPDNISRLLNDSLNELMITN
jgi:hypothetical protein